MTALEAQEYYQDKNYINDNTAKVKQLFEDVLVLIENDQVETVINTIMRLILGLEYPPAASVSECITQLCAQTRHDADRFKSCLVNYYLLPQVYVTDSPAYLFLRDFDDFAIKSGRINVILWPILLFNSSLPFLAKRRLMHWMAQRQL
ncbi:MAG: hypothetical protein HWD59_07470 [Coxiellaceae bacterium]|nr:MAG: hypothetical protein HWD59_07470 [Coxiellaceae bacterium]